MSVISGQKIDNVAKILVKSYEKKLAEVKEKINKTVNDEYLKLVPNDLLELKKKYPIAVKSENSINLYFDKLNNRQYRTSFYVQLNIPYIGMSKDKVIIPGSEIDLQIQKLAEEHAVIEDEINKISNQIKCTLSKLRTYRRIEEEFPEAYKVLITQVDKLPAIDNLCDNVEELRAKLNQKTNN